MLHSSYLWLASFGKKQCVYTTNQNVTLIHITFSSLQPSLVSVILKLLRICVG